MMTCLAKRFLSTSLVFLFSNVAAAEIFEYSQNVYTKDQAVCEQQATALAQRIVSTLGGTTKAAYCAPLTGGGFDARALTDVSSQPSLEVAVFGFRVVNYDYPGQQGAINKRYSVISDEATYHEATSCLKDLPKYESYFQNQTGMTPISAQCAQLTPHHYVPQVDGFGTGNQHLYRASIDIGSGNSSEASQLDLVNYLLSVGATPTNVAKPGIYIQINYFASREFTFSAFDFSRKNNFLNEAECLNSAKDVQSILSRRSASNLVSLRCGRGQWPTYQDSSAMVALFDETDSGQPSQKPKVYTYGQFQSYGDCRSKVPVTPDSFCAADIDIHGNFHGYALNVIQ